MKQLSSNNPERKYLILGCLFGILFSGMSLAQTEAEPPAMLTQVKGEVSISRPGQEPVQAKPFTKPAAGSRIRLSGKAQLRLIYFANGRQEYWTGPAEFQLGVNASKALSGKPKVQQLPPGTVNQIARLSPRIAAAGIQRGGLTLAKEIDFFAVTEITPVIPSALQENYRIYQEMRQQGATDDCTADLYWLGVLDSAGESDLYQAHLKDLQKRFPELGTP